MIFDINKIKTSSNSFFLIAGPCAIENEEITCQIAQELKDMCFELSIPLVFKASYRKANRTSYGSFTGIGDDKALSILRKIKHDIGLSVTTDIHESHEAEVVAEVADIIQIPAFLCRQTDLLIAAAKTGKVVNVKKGQFMSGYSMIKAAEKIITQGNEKVILTERGNSFGYGDFVVDMRNIAIMQNTGHPVVLDCTHANQRPNQSSGVTEGTAQFIDLLARSGIAAGAEGIFIETHPDPSTALSDGSNMLPLSEIKPLLERLVKIKKALRDV